MQREVAEEGRKKSLFDLMCLKLKVGSFSRWSRGVENRQSGDSRGTWLGFVVCIQKNLNFCELCVLQMINYFLFVYFN